MLLKNSVCVKYNFVIRLDDIPLRIPVSACPGLLKLLSFWTFNDPSCQRSRPSPLARGQMLDRRVPIYVFAMSSCLPYRDSWLFFSVYSHRMTARIVCWCSHIWQYFTLPPNLGLAMPQENKVRGYKIHQYCSLSHIIHLGTSSW